MERGPAGQVKAEQAAPVSTRSSVLPATSKGTQGSTGVMKVGQMRSIARQVLRPHQLVCGTNLFTSGAVLTMCVCVCKM